MFLRAVFPPLRSQINLCKRLKCTKYEWNVELKFPTLRSSRKQGLIYALLWTAFLLWESSIVGTALYHIHKGDLVVPEKVLNEAWLAGMVDVLGINVIGHFTAEDTLTLLRMMWTYEFQNVGDPAKGSLQYWHCKIWKLLFSQFTIASCGVSALSAGIFFVEPCSPPFLGALFLSLQREDSCSFPSPWKIWIRVGLMGLQGTMILWSLALTYLVMECVYMIPLGGLYIYMLDLDKAKNKNRWGKKSLLKERITRFNQIQILVSQLNFSFRKFALPGIFTMFTTLIIFFSYMIIKLGGTFLDNPVLFLFPISFLNTVGLYFSIATLAGKINSLSLKEMRRIQGLSRQWDGTGYGRREAAALISMRVRFGDNFVDNLTPIVMMNFCLEQIASLLLIH